MLSSRSGTMGLVPQRTVISEDEVVREIMLRPMPKKAFISMEELYAAVAFLASDGARNITGQAIAIDGGWTAQ